MQQHLINLSFTFYFCFCTLWRGKSVWSECLNMVVVCWWWCDKYPDNVLPCQISKINRKGWCMMKQKSFNKRLKAINCKGLEKKFAFILLNFTKYVCFVIHCFYAYNNQPTTSIMQIKLYHRKTNFEDDHFKSHYEVFFVIFLHHTWFILKRKSRLLALSSQYCHTTNFNQNSLIVTINSPWNGFNFKLSRDVV